MYYCLAVNDHWMQFCISMNSKFDCLNIFSILLPQYIQYLTDSIYSVFGFLNIFSIWLPFSIWLFPSQVMVDFYQTSWFSGYASWLTWWEVGVQILIRCELYRGTLSVWSPIDILCFYICLFLLFLFVYSCSVLKNPKLYLLLSITWNGRLG